MRQHLYTGDGKLRSFVNVYKGDEDVRYLDGPDTDAADGDELTIVPSVAGGNVHRVGVRDEGHWK